MPHPSRSGLVAAVAVTVLLVAATGRAPTAGAQPIGVQSAPQAPAVDRAAPGFASDWLRPLALELGAPLSETDIEVEHDAMIADGRSGDNFGRLTRLFVGRHPDYGLTRSLVWFDVDELPATEAIVEARVRLYLREAGPGDDERRDVFAYRIEDDWDEDDIDWNDRPDYDDDGIDSDYIGVEDEWRDWNVTGLVRDWRLGLERNRGIMLRMDDEDAGAYRGFDSTEASKEPHLQIEHVTDTVPPDARVEALPPFLRFTDFDVRWSGSDPEPATGIEHYWLSIQRNDEPWFQNPSPIAGTTAPFRGENGKRYGFRVQAVDRAGNLEPEGEAEAETLIDMSAPNTTIGALPPFVGRTFVVPWTGGDQPAGEGLHSSGIAHYDVQYNIGGGAWADLALSTQANSVTFDRPVFEGARLGFRVRAFDLAGNIEAFGDPEREVTVDLRPPVVRFLPGATPEDPVFVIRWAGDDMGGSGVASYDIQFRTGLGPWGDWQIGTRDTSRTFTGQVGKLYGFRARARDQIGNVGVYPDRPQLTVGVLDRETLDHSAFLPRLGKKD